MRKPVSFLALLVSNLAVGGSVPGHSPGFLNTTPSTAIDGLPVFYDKSDIELVEANHAFDSFWAANYVHTTDNRNFLVSLNAIVINGSATQRAGILSLDAPLAFFKANYGSVGHVKGSNGTLDPFNLTMPGGKFGLEIVPRNVTGGGRFPHMRIFNNLPETEFDIDLEMRGPTLLNAGLGSWFWVDDIQNQVSLPAARPHGTLVVNHTTLVIDPLRSTTWYDRQWGPTMPDTFCWFGLYLTDSDNVKSYMSIWHWKDPIEGDKSFATVQNNPGATTVFPLANFLSSTNEVYHSAVTGSAYPLMHNVTLPDGSYLVIKSVRPDQEYVMNNSTSAFYSGYVEVSGDFTGHGVVDIML
ncbi:hypothetical protein ASPFODRAFT_212858 [Aspergillus luchuensis CBS 106.47]|uniref:AttH domain-containing protein n=1 Tax=Aspergillus luchuensis (strain CBS 106.47) TaxID=1137211 RepID=A0A1M3T086_ASPLC|nr:hypothetical protein ASPFODRAFT_212858 [Aspergillus luchuensis CBS 106.47]